MAAVERLDRFADLEVINNIVEGGGAYTHDTAFALPLGFVYSLNLAKYEKAMYKERHTYNYKLLTTQNNGAS